MKKKMIVANWKMNPQTLQEAEDLFRLSVDAIACPPFVYLEALSKIDSGAILGAQDCHWEDEGAFTGEVSAKMLKNLGVKYVIVGHSERRWILGESDEIVNKKLKAALRNGLIPILAVGERSKGDDRKKVITEQLEKALSGVSDFLGLIAYEPVWAIGTGPIRGKDTLRVPYERVRSGRALAASNGAGPEGDASRPYGAGDAETPEHAIEAVRIIKGIVGDALVLYGGSVDSKNVGDFISKPEIAGVLVGGASVDRGEFKKILEIALNV